MIPVLLNLLTVAVLAFVGTRLLGGARHAMRPDVRAHMRFIARGIRLRHVLLAPPVLALVITALALLYLVPPLRWGWWTAIGGGGNPVTGVTTTTQGSPLEWIIPAVFLLLLLPALPLFAEREERMFRLGAERWSTGRRVWRGLQFGLVHAVVGIPIAAALALSIGGWYFTASYLWGHRRAGGDPHAGLLESTRAHLTYNAEVLLLVAVLLALGL